ncbi:MAG: ATPase [Bacteroidetes bacterium]|nr:ATPase [Bacteroidota bacterium]
MILIADSGSTKAEWVVLQGGSADDSVFTRGINPYHSSPGEISAIMAEGLGRIAGKRFDHLYFYGTGCNTTEKENIIREALAGLFPAGAISVGSDLLGAARALCKDDPGIACILGTGSNSCYYDGNSVITNVPPLGYILGDEGSAASMGRRLVADILKNQLPGDIRSAFFDTYQTNQAEILDNVYRKPLPSRYLGQFARFLSGNLDTPGIRKIAVTSLDEFITRNILQYPEATESMVHFTGGIAFHFREILTERLRYYNLMPGVITEAPMPDLIRYHLNKTH